MVRAGKSSGKWFAKSPELWVGGDLGAAVLEGEEDVFGLDVGVNDALAVNVIEGFQKLPGHFLDFGDQKWLVFPGFRVKIL